MILTINMFKLRPEEKCQPYNQMLTSIYNKCFPFRKYDKPYYNKKPWLTLALKESIKTKNKLYVSSTKGRNKEEKSTQY